MDTVFEINDIGEQTACDQSKWDEDDEFILEVLQNVFKLSSFRSNQKKIINASMENKDILVSMPTGKGKSLCYQLTAVCNDGITIVVSPTLSLINDQVKMLNNLNINATSLTSLTSAKEQQNILADLIKIENSNLIILYICPEKFESEYFLKVLEHMYINNKINRIVFDEAHCMVQWNDFRPSFTKIKKIRSLYPNIPVMALTATSTVKVQNEIIQELKIPKNNIVVFKSSINRSNLQYRVLSKTGNVIKTMFDRIVSKNNLKSTGIIYCFSKKNCETTASQLNELYKSYQTQHKNLNVDDINDNANNENSKIVFADFYHSETKNKQEVQANWMSANIRVMCCTIAFGLGINKSDVRYVFHETLPQSIDDLHQMCGRAGRDGNIADCVVYYSALDKQKLISLMTNNNALNDVRKIKGYMDVTEEMLAIKILNFEKLVKYCENIKTCRRKLQLDYFGEEFDEKLCMNTCDNCIKNNSQKKIQLVYNNNDDVTVNSNKKRKTTLDDYYILKN